MFELNRKSPINKGELHKIIIDLAGNTVDIEFKVGYAEGKEFKSIGVEKLYLQDRIELKDGQDKTVQEKSTDFTDFMNKLNHEGDTIDIALQTLRERKIIV